MLLSLHVLAAIIAIGPVTVAASMFPAAVRRGDADALRLLHRISTVYAVIGVAVPIFGLATASSLGVLGDAWLLTSIALTIAAAGLLGLVILPRQHGLLARASSGAASPPGDRSAARLGMITGVFNLLWAVVVVLMIVRPGSTTGV
ncbi:membrane protein [Dactylosporangium sucinum]|uniref:Membrane protein n=1 Tax=Dactylosporangium sucinum TaxID=1424081 RepID=A0A917TTM2_9ACTN|nr:membrane protein [Dactylosporangium sucinum]